MAKKNGILSTNHSVGKYLCGMKEFEECVRFQSNKMKCKYDNSIYELTLPQKSNMNNKMKHSFLH